MVDFKTDKRSLLVKAINGSDTVQGLLFTRLPGYLTTMSKANLDPVSSRSTCGPLLVMCAVIGSCYCMPMCVPLLFRLHRMRRVYAMEPCRCLPLLWRFCVLNRVCSDFHFRRPVRRCRGASVHRR